jgi:DNA-directed RNA polymerase specialized sigma24 family protein
MAEIERTERLLALILVQTMGGASQQKKIVQLSVAGFTNTEIADLLETTTAVVATSLYAARKGGKKKKQKAKKQ